MLQKYYNSCLSTLVTVTMKNVLNFSQIYFRIKGLSSSTKCNLVKRILICRGKIRLFRERLLGKKCSKYTRRPRKLLWVVSRARFLDLRISGKSEKTSLMRLIYRIALYGKWFSPTVITLNFLWLETKNFSVHWELFELIKQLFHFALFENEIGFR